MAQSRATKVLALSSGAALTSVVSIVATAVLARVLTVRDYATYRQTLLAFAFAAPLLTLSLPSALFYFLPGEEKNRRGLLYDNLILLTLMGCVFAAFLLLGGNELLATRFKNPDIAEPLRWMALYAIFMLPAGAVGACLTVQDKVGLLSIFNVVSRLFLMAAVIGVCLIWRNPYAPLLAHVGVAGLTFFVALWLMLYAVPKDMACIRLSSMTAMLKYAVPLGLASMLGTIALQMDKMIVAAMCTPEEFVVYANGAVEIPLIGMVTGSIAVVILSDMRKAITSNDPNEALRLFRQAALKSSCILLPVMGFLFVFAEDFITLLYSDKYMGSVLPFRLYLLILPVRIVFFGSALMALGWTKTVLIRSIFDLLINAVLSVILVHYVGYIGAVTATIATLYIWTVPYNLRCISRGFGCRMLNPIPFREVGKVLFAVLFAAMASSPFLMASHLSGWLRLSFAGVLFGALFIGFGCIVSEEIRGTFQQYYRRLRRA